MGNKKITFWELVMLNISALFGIRWIARSTSDTYLGLGAIPMWVLMMFLFFVPQAFMCAEMAASYPHDGGLAYWVKVAFGTKYGFLVSWMHWTALIFWFASFLTFFSVNATYMVGRPDLANNKLLVLIMSIAIIWILSIASMKGMEFGKYLTSAGSLGSTVPTVCLIVMSFLAVVVLKKAPSVSVYSVATMTPKLTMSSLVEISSIMFSYTGAQLAANFISEMENPQKNYPKAIITAAAIIGVLYVIGSTALTMLLPTSKIQSSTGILDALTRACELLGVPMVFVQVVAFGIALSVLGALVLYIAQPTKMLFGFVEPGVFSERITKVNEHGIPTKAVIFQAILVSILLIGVSYLPGVEVIYNTLVTMTALTTLFPYVFLFLAYGKIKREKEDLEGLYVMTKNKKLAAVVTYSVFALCVFAIICAALPIMGNTHDNIIYEAEMIGGSVLIVASGLLIWKRSGLKNKVIPVKDVKQSVSESESNE